MPGGSTQTAQRVINELILALLLMITAAAAAELLHALLGLTRLSILFLAAVTVTASLRGSRAALIAAVLGVVFYKIFLDLRTEEQTGFAEDVLNLLIFLIVALITGTLAGRMRDEAERSGLRADRMARLVTAARVLSDENEETFWQVLANTVGAVTRANAFVFDTQVRMRSRSGEAALCEDVRQVAQRALSGPKALIERGDRWSVRAVCANGPAVAALAWENAEPDPEVEGVIELLAELASASISRMRVRHEQMRARAAEEASRLRETVLSSISHDFRSPLSAIIGSATSLLEYGEQFDAGVRRDLLLNIQNEGEKLNDFIGSLLNMSRLQAGVMEPSRQKVSVDEVIRGAIERLNRHKGQVLNVELEGECKAFADALLLEQAIYNILDNAVKYASPTGDVRIHCTSAAVGCEIVVADEGPGLSPDDQQVVFGKFRGSGAMVRKDSTGLGLYIAKGFVEAMGGSIHARDRTDGKPGLEMIIKLASVR